MKKENTSKKDKKAFLRTNGLKISSVIFNLKKLFLPWLITAVLSAGIIIGSSTFISPDIDALSATIAYNYNGIEDGLDPNGCELNTDAIKSDTLIYSALEAEGLSADIMQDVQDGIFVDGIVSSSAVAKITEYNSIYNSGSGSWTEQMKDTAYHPTQFRVSFNYNKTGLDGEQAASLLNRILENYNLYFIETYGYSEAISETLLSVDFNNYDYLIALDMYSTKLGSLADYVNTLSYDDPGQFRCDETGYSFSDISGAVSLIRSVDIDTLISYILNNGVISDKNMILSYYDYRIDNLQRLKTSASERLASIEESIKTYQKDSVIIYDSNGAGNSSVTETSDTYDKMIQQKLYYQELISDYNVSITDYSDRIESIKKLSGSATKAHQEYVDERIASITEKVAALTDSLKITADDYFENEKFTHAFSVLSPAEYSFTQFVKSVVNESMRLIVIAELGILTVYLFICIAACIYEPLKRRIHISKND